MSYPYGQSKHRSHSPVPPVYGSGPSPARHHSASLSASYGAPSGGHHYQAPPGADPKLWQWFSAVDINRSGSIGVDELQKAFNGELGDGFDVWKGLI
jgi:hypothetical protein